MLHPKFEQARIASNILKSYNNSDALVTPIINQIEFEKSIIEDKITIVPDEVMKSWAGKMQEKLQNEKDAIKKSELSQEIEGQIRPLHKVDVVFNSVVKSVWADIVDVETKRFKDNSLTRKLNISGKTVA